MLVTYNSVGPKQIFFAIRAAFFCGQIEERRTSRMTSWFGSGDLEIQVAVSSVGVYLIEPHEGVWLNTLHICARFHAIFSTTFLGRLYFSV